MLKKQDLAASAKVVDGTLILTLPNAISPIVWRMELGTVKSSALEVRSGANDTSVLTLKTPKGDVNDIAAFAAKKDAVDALMSVSRAMENAHGQIVPKGNGEGFHQKLEKSKKKRWILTIIGVLIVLFLINLMMSMSPTSMPSSSGSGFASSETTEAARKTVGEPVSADDLLGQ
jgi:hypothetical protein